MPPVVYLKPGETPLERAYCLVICDPKMPATHFVRHSNCITHFMRTGALAGMLPAIVAQAEADGHGAVYVAEPQGEMAEVPAIVPEDWLGKWSD